LAFAFPAHFQTADADALARGGFADEQRRVRRIEVGGRKVVLGEQLLDVLPVGGLRGA
jgi:hypothetical protein